MTYPAPPTIGATVRYGLSIFLSIVALVGSISFFVLLMRFPETYLGEGAYGLSPNDEALYDSFPFFTLSAIAALALLIKQPRREPPWRRRLPWVLAIVAASIIGVSMLLPLVFPVATLVIGVVLFTIGVW